MTNRRIIIAGTTGLVGQALLQAALADASIAQVHSLSRRPLDIEHEKLHAHIVDFSALGALPLADELYLALGTTIKVAGSRAAFRAVDYEANLAVAKAALGCGVKRVGLVSAMGASAKSAVFYSRVKGELEDAMLELGFEGSVFVRPSLLLGDRAALGQPTRMGERLGVWLCHLFGGLVPRSYKPVTATAVAKALLAHVPEAKGRRVILSAELAQGK